MGDDFVANIYFPGGKFTRLHGEESNVLVRIVSHYHLHSSATETTSDMLLPAECQAWLVNVPTI